MSVLTAVHADERFDDPRNGSWPITRATLRVPIGGALARAVTAAIGHLLGVQAG